MKNKLLYLPALVITLILPLLFLFPVILNYNKSADNTKILGIDYSNLNRDQIEKQLEKDFVLPPVVILKSNTKEYQLNLASISAQINKTKTANTILYRRLDEGIIAYIKYFFKPKSFYLDIFYNDNALDKYLSDLSTQHNRPYVPSEFHLKNNSVEYIQGELGQEVDIDALKKDVINNLSLGKFDKPIDIVINKSGFLPSEEQINGTKSKASKLIGKSLNLVVEDKSVNINDQTLISWLSFNNDFNDSEINTFVKSTSQSLKRDPVDAIFKFENNQVLEFRPSTPGIIPEEDKLVDLLKTSTNNLISTSDKTISVNVSYKTIDPAIKNSDANDLGIKELLGRGVSTFKHSDSIRNFNVEKGASTVNRVLVAPGDTFSFVKTLGVVSLDSGFKKAYIIREGRTELDVGGGICQVSTTLFRAMLNAGLNIIERQPHAYRVSYYEEDSPPGYDATVFIPSPDLKFINDTGHYVLIQSTFDGVNKKLTYEIYGTSDGRKAEISNYRKWGAQPAPPDRYIDDPTLPPGKIVQVEHRIPGLKTAFDWKVMRDGQTLHEKTFQSSYVPWAAVYRRGI